MKPGDLVTNRGILGRVVEVLEGGRFRVEVGESERVWSSKSIRNVNRERGPRGVQRAYPRALEDEEERNAKATG